MLTDPHQEHGSMPLALLASIVVAGIVMVLFGAVLTSERAVRNDRAFTTAFHGSDAGVQEALARVRALDDDNSQPLGTVLTGTTTTGNVEYQYEATKGIRQWEIRAVGEIDGSTRVVEGVVDRPSRFFLAAFGKTLVGFKGGNGAASYNGTAANTGNGAVGTNGDIELNGNAYADLLFLFGPDAQCAKTQENCDAMADKTAGQPQPYIPETDFIQDALDSAWCQSSITAYRTSVDGDLVPGGGDGPNGEYCFSSMNFDTDMLLPGTTGEVIVYVSGGISSVNDSEINCPGCSSLSSNPTREEIETMLAGVNAPDASRLQLYSVGTSVSLGNHTHLGAAVYAPNASCHGNPSNAQGYIYGSMLCNDINNQGGWSFWFDERLEDIGGGEWRVQGIREEVGGSTSFD